MELMKLMKLIKLADKVDEVIEKNVYGLISPDFRRFSQNIVLRNQVACSYGKDFQFPLQTKTKHQG